MLLNPWLRMARVRDRLVRPPRRSRVSRVDPIASCIAGDDHHTCEVSTSTSARC